MAMAAPSSTTPIAATTTSGVLLDVDRGADVPYFCAVVLETAPEAVFATTVIPAIS